ncbi:MAG: hypothetical protein JSV00_08940, partial [bacterium]
MRGARTRILATASVALLVLLGGMDALAEELVLETPECGAETQRGYGLCVGFEGLSLDGGGETILPYRYLESYPTAKGHYHQPVRFGLLDLSFTYDGDGYYTFSGDNYGGSTVFVLQSSKFVKNIEHENLPGPFSTAGAPDYWSTDLDPADEYALDIEEHYASVRYKWSGYPAHVAVAVRRFENEGEKQQIFLNENCATRCHNISGTREVATTTDQLFISGDAHMGPVDVSYQYKGTQFADDMPDPVYSFGTIFSFSGTRDVHNAYPDVESSEHTLNVSTNHTGRVTGFLGVGLGERENTNTGIREEYRNLLGRFLWRPNTSWALTLDSRQFYRQDDDPGALLQSLRLADGSPLRYGTVESRHRAIVSYYPVRGVDLKGAFTRTQTEREDNELWGLPDETVSNEMRFTARLKPLARLKVDATFSDRSTDDPAYRTTPTDSRAMTLGGHWIPSARLSLEANLKDFRDENSRSGLLNERQILEAGLTYVPSAPVSLVFRAYQFTSDITTDVTFADISPTPVIGDDVPYSAEGIQYLLQATWRVGKNTSITGQFNHLEAQGAYKTSAPLGMITCPALLMATMMKGHGKSDSLRLPRRSPASGESAG